MVGMVIYWSVIALLIGFGAFLRFGVVGYSFSALVCFCLAALLLCYGGLHLLITKFGSPWRAVRTVLTVLVCIGMTVILITEGIIIHASFGDPDEHCDYIVVLGCMVWPNGPSPTLQNRIDAAYNYLEEHPGVIAVLSGGKGKDEPMSEAQCMYEGLLKKGIDPDRLWIEDQATSTWTNLQYSLALIESRTGVRPETIGILSSEYHLFRASLQAKDQGVKTVGIPARSTLVTQAINHFMREVAGVWHYILLGGQYD